MDLDRLYQILSETTAQLRKGAEIEHERVGPLDVTHVYAMPHESQARPDVEKVDCVFVTIGVDKVKAEAVRTELVTILNSYPDRERLAGGPSYIEVGGIIGDQGAAFQLFALGEVLGLWKVITPRTLHFTDEAEIRKLAGQGLVMISGYKATCGRMVPTGTGSTTCQRVVGHEGICSGRRENDSAEQHERCTR